MKFAIIITLAALPLLCAGQEQVRADKPTVVTVYGKQKRVKMDKSKKSVRVWNRLGSIPGWLLNVDDVIPAARERQSFTR